MGNVQSEQAVLNEAIEILLQHMSLDKAARVMAALRVGDGDYLDLREQLFAGDTVQSSAATVRAHQQPQADIDRARTDS